MKAVITIISYCATLLYCCIFLVSCHNEEDQMIEIAINQSAENKTEILKALTHYKEGTQKSKAMKFIIINMIDKESCDNKATEYVKSEMQKENNINKIWKNALNYFPQQNKIHDLRTIKSTYLIKDIDLSYKIWKKSKWHKEIDFSHYCNYILPYRILGEPIADWREFLYKKYFFLIKDCKTQEQAFQKVYSYLATYFHTTSEYVPYENDVLLLDVLKKGDCKSRTIFMTYVMRALGICASFDYTPIWANCSDNSHSWVSLVLSNDTTIFPKDSIYIEGSYERLKYCLPNNYALSTDSLKRISKIYRKTFKNYPNNKEKGLPFYLNSKTDIDVTSHYPFLTKNNVVSVKATFSKAFYVCTYKQQVGWVPISKAKQISCNKVDVGGMVNDCVIIVATLHHGIITPISAPYKISHDKLPQVLRIIPQKKQILKLYRKYALNNRWINRWGDIIGTTIETSTNKMFNKNVDTIHVWEKLPMEETSIFVSHKLSHNYIRILPAKNKYPVFAEIQLFDSMNCEIPAHKYKFYSVGDHLTGDTLVVRSLYDHNEETTFFKQFPHWIGIDISKCKSKLSKINFILWNDLNRIQKKHTYELFYYNDGWISLGKKKASSDCLIFHHVPTGCLFLLKDYTMGKEERIFEYINGKQIWW